MSKLKSDPQSYGKLLEIHMAKKLEHFNKGGKDENGKPDGKPIVFTGESGGAKVPTVWSVAGLVPRMKMHEDGDLVYDFELAEGLCHKTALAMTQAWHIAHKLYWKELYDFSVGPQKHAAMIMRNVYWDETIAYQEASFAIGMFKDYKKN